MFLRGKRPSELPRTLGGNCWIISVVLLFSLIALGGCSPANDEPTSTNDEPVAASGSGGGDVASVDKGSSRRIQIMDPVEANNIHVPIADSRGYFAEQGLNVEVSGTSAGKFAMDALNAGGVDYAVVVEMNVAHTIFNSDDVVILCELAEPTRAIKVLGRRDQGVNSPADLKGKKIGVLFGVNIHLFIEKFLEANGYTTDDVQLVNLRPPDAVVAFQKGDIDVVITWQPHAYKLQKDLGENAVVLTDDSASFWTYKMVLVTKRSTLEQNEDEAERIVRAMVKADEYIRDHEEEVYGILADHINLDEEAVRSFFDEIHFEVRVTQGLVDMLTTEVKWLASGMLEGKEPLISNYRDLVANVLRDVDSARFQIAGE